MKTDRELLTIKLSDSKEDFLDLLYMAAEDIQKAQQGLLFTKGDGHSAPMPILPDLRVWVRYSDGEGCHACLAGCVMMARRSYGRAYLGASEHQVAIHFLNRIRIHDACLDVPDIRMPATPSCYDCNDLDHVLLRLEQIFALNNHVPRHLRNNG